MRPPMRSPTELRRLVIVNFGIFINIFSYFRQSLIRTAQDGESAERREIDIIRQQLKEALEKERVREGIEVDQQFEEQLEQLLMGYRSVHVMCSQCLMQTPPLCQ